MRENPEEATNLLARLRDGVSAAGELPMMLGELARLYAEIGSALSLLRRLASAGLLPDGPPAPPRVAAGARRQRRWPAGAPNGLATPGEPPTAPGGPSAALPGCEACGGPIPARTGRSGPARKYCSSACQKTARSKRQRAREAGGTTPVRAAAVDELEPLPDLQGPLYRTDGRPDHSDPSRLTVPALPWETEANA